jgi:hypothetical protein
MGWEWPRVRLEDGVEGTVRGGRREGVRGSEHDTTVTLLLEVPAADPPSLTSHLDQPRPPSSLLVREASTHWELHTHHPQLNPSPVMSDLALLS